MKKFIPQLLVLTMALSMTAFGAENSTTEVSTIEESTAEVPEFVTLTTRDGAGETVEVEFPYNPERIAVMDLAALDILDNLGVTDPIVGVSKGSSIDYLQDYLTDDDILNLGNVKEADLEAVMEADPEIIFIGGRMSSLYDELAEIAPVYVVYTDMEVGVVESTLMNARNIASLFGLEEEVEELVDEYNDRIEALQELAEGKTAIVGMVNAGGFALLGNDGRCSLIGREIGFDNIGVEEEESSESRGNSQGGNGSQSGRGGNGGNGGQSSGTTSAHGNEASFELVLQKNPDYIFVMDRDAAIGTEGAQLAAEVMDNELVNKTTAAENGHVIVLEHSNVWYTAEGGITALGIMLSDLEAALQ